MVSKFAMGDIKSSENLQSINLYTVNDMIWYDK
jgi:hypothetical protein